MGLLVLWLLVTALVPFTAEAIHFNVVHKYAHLEGSPQRNGGRSASPAYFDKLVAHHNQRRRLLGPAAFYLGGNSDVDGFGAAGLYYTEIGLGTPPRPFFVQVDTGSDVLWVTCAPCTGCPPNSTLPGVTVAPYDPTLSTTETVLPCTSVNCGPASNTLTPLCDAVGSCAYEISYGDGSNTTGYIINDAFTFLQYNMTAPNAVTAPVYFGCGTLQNGFDNPQSAIGGIMGFGQASVSVPSQLAALGIVNSVFAHCLQGDATIGGGYFVIGNITELGLVYTPIITDQSHYNVGMQNIAVNGVNITTPLNFDIVPGLSQGVIMDSGTTLATLAEPAFSLFLATITASVPIPPVTSPSGRSCWLFPGDVTTVFPPVTLFFDGGVMNLSPRNYLFPMNDTAGLYQCMGWSSGTTPADGSSITIWGDIVLKDLLVVYDNVLHQIGWKPFNCSTTPAVSF